MAEEKLEQMETAGGAENPGGPTEPVATPPAQPETPPAEPAAPPSFEEMLNGNSAYRSEFDRRMNQAVETARQNWEERNRQDVDEATKLARMTEAQRQKYLLDKDRKALDADRAAFAHQQLQVSVGSELQKRGLSADFAPWLTGQDADRSRENIDRFETLWNSSITAAVNARMRSDTPPRDPKVNAALDRETIRKMTPEEINKRWPEIQAALSNNKRG